MRSAHGKKTVLGVVIVVVSALLAAVAMIAPWQERGADNTYDTTVGRPALTKRPRVVFDHGHNNSHSINGRFAPFRRLLEADGARVTSLNAKITPSALEECDVLVIVNACGPEPKRDSSAFTQEEIDVIRDWVSGGGSLLLAADHHPYGVAAAPLAHTFGIEMMGGWCEDEAHGLTGTADTGAIVYRIEDALLGAHPIINGGDQLEIVKSVATFTGQSIIAPEGATPLLMCSPTALYLLPISSNSETTGGTTTTTFETRTESASGHCQALAMNFGRGRVVVAGEAAMLSAQIDAQSGLKFGMNVPGVDNRQFVLNVCRWLARELD